MDLGFIKRSAEQQIQEAIDEGKFDNLPGSGKPIVFDDDPMTPPHLRLANRILKNANVLPEWIELQKQIEQDRRDLVALADKLHEENWRRHDSVATLPPGHPLVERYAEWHARSRAGYLRHLKGINTSILKFSMLAPRTAVSYPTYKVDAEMQAFDEHFPNHAPDVSAACDTDREAGALRRAAYARYGIKRE